MLNFSIIDNLIASKPQKVAVATSGGADSMCLTHLLSEWCKRNKIEITALVVDHGLRKESEAESSWVKGFLTEKGIKTTILKLEWLKPKSNIQDKARAARYKILEQYCAEHKIKHLFVGHNLNDQAETVLMRIIRGSGIDGVSGIAKVTRYGGIKLLRPLLSITRAQIEGYLKRVGWSWVNDPSNLNHKYDRIKVRSMLTSYAEEFNDDMIYKRIGLLTENALRAKSYINKRVHIAWAKYVKIDHFNFISLDNAAYKLHEEVKLRLMLRIFKYFRPKLVSPRLASLVSLLVILQGKQAVIKTLSGCIIKKNAKHTMFILEVGKNPKVTELKLGANIWYNFKIIVGKEGLTARMLGAEGWRYLKSLDYIKPNNMPIEVIHSLLAIYRDEKDRGKKLIYVPCLKFKDANIKIDISKL